MTQTEEQIELKKEDYITPSKVQKEKESNSLATNGFCKKMKKDDTMSRWEFNLKYNLY